MTSSGGITAARSRRVSVTASLWVSFALLTYFAGAGGQPFALWQGVLLAVPLLLAAAWFGWRGALLVAAASLGVLLLRDGAGGTLALADHVATVAAMLVAAAVGLCLRRSLRDIQRRAADSERRTRLLQQAALELNQAQSDRELFKAAPRLLSDILSFTHAEMFVPQGDELLLSTSWQWQPGPGFSIPLDTVIGRAFRTGQLQYVLDTQLDDDYMPAPGATPTRSELALPVKVGGEVRAVINLEHVDPDAFSPVDRETLLAFTRIIEEVLERLDATFRLEQEGYDQEFLARLTQRLLQAEDAKQAASITLGDVMSYLGGDAGAVVELRHSKLQPLASTGTFPPGLGALMEGGLAFDGLLRDVWTAGRATFVDDLLPNWTPPADLSHVEPVRSAALIPIANQQGAVRALLGLITVGEARHFSDRERRLIEAVGTSLGAALDRATLSRQLFATLDVIRSLPRSDDPATLYQLAAEAAVDLIPGAEAASVLVRHGDLFRFEAAAGYELAEIKDGAGPFTLEEELRWYGGSEEDYRRGVGRILRGQQVIDHSFASSPGRPPAHLEVARVTEIKSNILIPIVDNDDVVAMLNIDTFSTESAYGEASLRLAEAFAQHIAVIVRQSEQLRALERTLVTDPLTGLGNREGFQRMLTFELARATRYGSPLNLVMLDLDNFKQVNDRFGHHAGDAALVAVAGALRKHLRASDHAFRWGGDEFVLLLPDVDADEARAAAERFAGIVGEIEVDGLHLAASVGVASYPDDAGDPESLLRRADDLMYDRKQGSQRLIG